MKNSLGQAQGILRIWGAMASSVSKRITLWTLENEFIDPEYLEKIDVGGATTLKALRFTLELHDLLEWPFDFWDAEDKK